MLRASQALSELSTDSRATHHAPVPPAKHVHVANPAALELAHALSRDPRAWRKGELEARWSRPALVGALRRGLVERVLPGIYAATAHSESLLVRAHAAHLWCGADSVLTGVSAAAVWGLCDVPRVVTMACRPGLHKDPIPAWLRIRRSDATPPSTLWGACPIAVPEWAAVTAYSQLPPRSRDAVMYRASQVRDVTAEGLAKAAAAVPRIKGRRHLMTVLAAIAAGSESDLETHALLHVFNTAKFAHVLRQHWVKVGDSRFRLDMYDPISMTAVELDGSDHGRPQQRQRDITRDAQLLTIGIATLRFSNADARQRGAWVRQVTAEVFDSRS